MLSATRARPRLGFLGLGWIGQNRLEAVVESGHAKVVALADASEQSLEKAQALAPSADCHRSLEELLDRDDLDALVIATPSAQHAVEASRALARGLHVFCQKPLGRSLAETREVISVAERHDRLLRVDFCYRRTRALEAVKALVDHGELGTLYAARLVFHNAYGPDKPWYYDRALSGGGCVMDLGIHLCDLAVWFFGPRAIRSVRSGLYARGERLALPPRAVEDYAVAQLELSEGPLVELACSWNLPAGRDAVINVELFGTAGGAQFRNVAGSFYDFEAVRMQGTRESVLFSAKDAWGGRTTLDFIEQLARAPRFDAAEAARLATVAGLVDRIYGMP